MGAHYLVDTMEELETETMVSHRLINIWDELEPLPILGDGHDALLEHAVLAAKTDGVRGVIVVEVPAEAIPCRQGSAIIGHHKSMRPPSIMAYIDPQHDPDVGTLPLGVINFNFRSLINLVVARTNQKKCAIYGSC